jgi:hypothetical protein
VSDGMIARLSRICGRDVHGSQVINVMWESSENRTLGADLGWTAFDNHPDL